MRAGGCARGGGWALAPGKSELSVHRKVSKLVAMTGVVVTASGRSAPTFRACPDGCAIQRSSAAHRGRRSYARATAPRMQSKVQLLEQRFRSLGIFSVGAQGGRAFKSERREGVCFVTCTPAAVENGAL